MTDIERQMNHFHANAPSCKPHGERPTLGFDGTHYITCPKGCHMMDAEHASMTPLMLKWDETHGKRRL